MSSTGNTVLYENIDDHIAFVTLNRPSRLNAFSADMLEELVAALERFDSDPEASVAIITGAGSAFSSGADIKELAEVGELRGGEKSQTLLYRAKNWKPVVAAVHGYVIGMALELVFQSEYVVAADSTRFQVAETIHGVSTGPIWPIVQFRAGAAFANDVCVSGRVFDAREAEKVNLVNEVVPEKECKARALQWAQHVAGLPQQSIRQTVRVARWYGEQHQLQSLPFFEMSRHLTGQVFRGRASR